MKLFLVLTLALFGLATGLRYGDSCTDSSQCNGQLHCFQDPRSQVAKLTCRCNAGYIFSNSSNDCVSMSRGVCNNDWQCQDRDLNRGCVSNQCQCKNNYYQASDFFCRKPPVGRGQACNNNYECQESLYCYLRQKKCLCKVGYFWSPAEKRCVSMGSSYQCAMDKDCQDRDPNRVCKAPIDVCACRDGFEVGDDAFCGKPKATYNETCNTNQNCAGGLNCYKTPGIERKRCLCSPGYIWKSRQCSSMSYSSCQEDAQCQDQDPNRVCSTSGSCVCRATFSVNSNTYMCVRKKMFGEACTDHNECFGALNCYSSGAGRVCKCSSGQVWSELDKDCVSVRRARCTTDDVCKDADQRRYCNATQQCGCKTGYYEDYYGDCVQQKMVGAACQHPDQCQNANSMCYMASCLSPQGVCVCRPTHRLSGQFCLPKSCTFNADCHSQLFDEDANLICGQDQKCRCKPGYRVDLTRARCVAGGEE